MTALVAFALTLAGLMALLLFILVVATICGYGDALADWFDR